MSYVTEAWLFTHRYLYPFTAAASGIRFFGTAPVLSPSALSVIRIFAVLTNPSYIFDFAAIIYSPFSRPSLHDAITEAPLPSKVIPLSSVLPEGIKDILEYDRSHHTEYYPTLVSYSRHDMKLKDTAEDLKIHTSTLKYRLQKIKTMLKMDIYEPDNKLYLGIIFFLLESPS